MADMGGTAEKAGKVERAGMADMRPGAVACSILCAVRIHNNIPAVVSAYEARSAGIHAIEFPHWIVGARAILQAHP
jgi:hypothetical protein